MYGIQFEPLLIVSDLVARLGDHTRVVGPECDNVCRA